MKSIFNASAHEFLNSMAVCSQNDYLRLVDQSIETWLCQNLLSIVRQTPVELWSIY